MPSTKQQQTVTVSNYQLNIVEHLVDEESATPPGGAGGAKLELKKTPNSSNGLKDVSKSINTLCICWMCT